MGWDRVRQHALMVLFLLASLVAAPAAASTYGHEEPSFAPSCHAASDLDTDITAMATMATGATIATPGSAWVCSDTDWVANQPVAWLLFTADAWEGEKPPHPL